MQPSRPHPHSSPPIRTTMCPISPATPRPVHGRPSRTMPPPTPVPQKTPRTERYGRPAPSSNSASVATWTSLPRCARVPSASSSAAPRANSPAQSDRFRAFPTVPAFGSPSPAGAAWPALAGGGGGPAAPPGGAPRANPPPQSDRFRAFPTVPAFGSTSPGEPTPTPARASVSTWAWWAASVIAAAMAVATAPGPPSVGVGWRAWPITAWSGSTTTAWIFVPPRSIPPRGAPAFVLDMTRHAMRMDRRLKTSLAVAGALAVAEAGVRLLRPRDAGPDPAPVDASEYFSPEEIDRARAFRRPQRALGLTSVAVDAALLAALVARPPEPLTRRYRHPAAAGAVAAAALSAGLTLATLPIAAVSRTRSLKVGLATQSWGGWAADLAKSTAIGAVFAAAGGSAAVGLMRRFPRVWWAPGAAGAVGFGVLTTYLGPVVLDPIFNRFTPLPEGRERADVLELAEAAGVDVGEVYEVDASRRTTAANAYVNGLGRTKRVVLFDTLIRDFTRDEVRLVVAHELCHVRHDDVRRLLAFLPLGAPAGTLAVARVPEAIRNGNGDPAGPAAVPALALAAMLVGAPVNAVTNRLSRRIEARTDEFALRLTDAPEPFIGFEKRITIKNIAEPEPPAWAELLFGTHPSTLQRIGAAVAFRESAPREDRRTPAGS